MNQLTKVEPQKDQMLSIIEKVMLDPNCDVDKMDKAKRLGASTYITKPLVLDELVRAVMGKKLKSQDTAHEKDGQK